MKMDALKEHPQIVELLDTLDKNDMHKEKEEVLSLVDYIGDMEKTLSEMLKEMQGMREEINLIHNSTVRARCQSLVRASLLQFQAPCPYHQDTRRTSS